MSEQDSTDGSTKDTNDTKKAKEPRGLKKITDSFKAAPGKHAADANDPVRKSVQETVEKVNAGVNDAVKNLQKAAKDAKAKAEASASKNTDKKSEGADADSAFADKAAA